MSTEATQSVSKTTTALTVVSAAIGEFDRVAAGLAELTKQYKGVVYPVTTVQGMAAAKAARTAIRRPRYDIERIRKEAKAPILSLGRELDTEAARIRDEILAIENPIDEQITNEEKRKEDERLAKIEAERQRQEDIQNRIHAIRNWPASAVGKSSALVEQQLQSANDFTVDETFGEWAPNARAALEASRASLSGILANAKAQESQQARIAAEREELARLRAQQEERERLERERLAEEERKAAAERAALAAQQEEQLRLQREEQARLNAEARQHREAEEAEHRERMRLQQEEADRAERERKAARDAEIAAENERLRAQREELDRQAEQQRVAKEAEEQRLASERGEIQRQQEAAAAAQREEEERKARETAAEQARKAEQARLAAIQRPTDDEMIAVLASHYSVPDSKVLEWLSSMIAPLAVKAAVRRGSKVRRQDDAA